jgi:hypothetical protein
MSALKENPQIQIVYIILSVDPPVIPLLPSCCHNRHRHLNTKPCNLTVQCDVTILQICRKQEMTLMIPPSGYNKPCLGVYICAFDEVTCKENKTATILVSAACFFIVFNVFVKDSTGYIAPHSCYKFDKYCSYCSIHFLFLF